MAAVLQAQNLPGRRVDPDNDLSAAMTTQRELQIKCARQEGRSLNQHAGTCAALALTSMAIAWQATVDWRRYRKLPSLSHMETWLLRQRRPFFFRNSVLVTATLSFGAVYHQFGGVRLFYWPDFDHRF